jgi:GntR family transcriptional regulator of vanillate catabolism
MRELLLRGEFRPGERIREIHLAARLNVSRTPLRLVLGRLEEEGLVAARPTGGFVASEFSVRDIHDGIEIRGVLEGTAARLAAERVTKPEELTEIRACLARIDRLIQRWASGTDSLAKYIALNARFHGLLVDLARSSMVRRAVARAIALPFASPNAFLMGHAQKKEGRHHRRDRQQGTCAGGGDGARTLPSGAHEPGDDSARQAPVLPGALQRENRGALETSQALSKLPRRSMR